MKRAIRAFGVAAIMVTATVTTADLQSIKPIASKPGTAKVEPQRAVGTTGRLSSVQQTLRRDPQLASRIGERLPAKIDVMWASSGFRTLGQFVATVNASNNLAIPFVTLKSRIVDRRMSLGQAIRRLRPSADYRKEARRAERDAQTLIRAGERRKP